MARTKMTARSSTGGRTPAPHSIDIETINADKVLAPNMTEEQEKQMIKDKKDGNPTTSVFTIHKHQIPTVHTSSNNRNSSGVNNQLPPLPPTLPTSKPVSSNFQKRPQPPPPQIMIPRQPPIVPQQPTKMAQPRPTQMLFQTKKQFNDEDDNEKDTFDSSSSEVEEDAFDDDFEMVDTLQPSQQPSANTAPRFLPFQNQPPRSSTVNPQQKTNASVLAAAKLFDEQQKARSKGTLKTLAPSVITQRKPNVFPSATTRPTNNSKRSGYVKIIKDPWTKEEIKQFVSTKPKQTFLERLATNRSYQPPTNRFESTLQSRRKEFVNRKISTD